MASLRTGPKRALIIVGVVGALFAYREAAYYGYVPRPDVLKSVVPMKIETVNAEVLGDRTDLKVLPLPSTSTSNIKSNPIKFLIWEWNANMGAIFANGGVQTTKGSLMEKNGVNVKFERKDDATGDGGMRDQQITFAQDYCQSGKDAPESVKFVTVMGDGGAQYLGPANEKLKGYGLDCQLEIVTTLGYSRGEDKFMGPAEWKTNPKAALGGLVAGVLRDGDWNLAMRWAHENNIPNNPDETTYDPRALNWVSTNDYIDAAQKYVSGYCEQRKLKDKPSQTVNVCVNGVVTWTPGDVIVAQKKGGLVSLMDTGSAIFQMPCVMIGLKKWDAAHADLVAGIIAAAGEGADQIRTNPAALKRAGEISAQIYHDQTGDYWVRYYKGVTENDATGVPIALGGSSVSNLADMFQTFGLSGGPNLFGATYTTFGNVVVQQYPNNFKSFPPAGAIQNTRYLQMAAAKAENVDKGAAEKVTYDSAPIKSTTAQRAYSVNFASGSAEILPDSYATLDDITSYLMTENTKVSIVGHTDSSGSAEGNRALSKARAQSVRQYLVAKGKSAIPSARFVTVEGHGQDEPVASNATAEGRAQNRRVAISLGR